MTKVTRIPARSPVCTSDSDFSPKTVNHGIIDVFIYEIISREMVKHFQEYINLTADLIRF